MHRLKYTYTLFTKNSQLTPKILTGLPLGGNSDDEEGWGRGGAGGGVGAESQEQHKHPQGGCPRPGKVQEGLVAAAEDQEFHGEQGEFDVVGERHAEEGPDPPVVQDEAVRKFLRKAARESRKDFDKFYEI